MAGFQDFGKLPDLSGSTTEAALKKVENYLFLLQEQLTFLFQNLGIENINDQSVSELKTLFTKEIQGRIEDNEEHLAELDLTAEHMMLSFSDADQRISRLTQGVDGLTVTVSDADRRISQLKQGVDGLTVTVSDADQRISQLKQSVDGLSLSVTDRNGVVSSVDLSSGTLDLKNLVFSVLKENGATVINGGNIQTGTISAVDIQGVKITGAQIIGSSLSSISNISQVIVDNGSINFCNGDGTLICGSLGYDGLGRMVLESVNDSVLRIGSANNLAINAKNGKTIYIGCDVSTVQSVELGNANSTINLRGTVTVNGKTIS